jgi:hypothetical protein
VTVDGLEAIARPGQLVPVTLIFDKAGRITFNVVIQSGTGPFASFAPTAQPTPASISPATTSSPSATESASQTTSPTASSTG